MFPPILQTIRGNSYTILLMSLIFESLFSSLPSLLSLSDFHNGFPAAAAMIDVSTEFNHFDGSGELVCPTQHNNHHTFLSNGSNNDNNTLLYCSTVYTTYNTRVFPQLLVRFIVGSLPETVMLWQLICTYCVCACFN